MFSKGADSVIKARLSQNFHEASQQNEQLRKTDRFLDRASRQGYRTLLVAFRTLSYSEVKRFLQEVEDAEDDIHSRA